MLYSTLNIGEKEYKLRLNAKNSVALEEKLGKHPLAVIMELQEQSMPRTADVVQIIFYALRSYQPTIRLDDVYDIYDEFVGEGKSIADVIKLLVDIFKTAGFIPEETEVEVDDEGKNA